VVVLVVGAPRLVPLAVLASGALALAGAPKVYELTMGGDNEYSLMTRVEAWRIMGEIVSINPLLGLGFANYSWYTPLFPILGYAVQFNSHNNFVDILAQTGVIGLLCFLWFAGAVGWIAWRLRTRVPDGFQRAYVIGALGGLAGTMAAAMLGDWVLPYVYNIGFAGFRYSVLAWVFLGGLLVIEQNNRAEVVEEGTSRAAGI
jgi:O-antigen ligase